MAVTHALQLVVVYKCLFQDGCPPCVRLSSVPCRLCSGLQPSPEKCSVSKWRERRYGKPDIDTERFGRTSRVLSTNISTDNRHSWVYQHGNVCSAMSKAALDRTWNIWQYIRYKIYYYRVQLLYFYSNAKLYWEILKLVVVTLHMVFWEFAPLQTRDWSQDGWQPVDSRMKYMVWKKGCLGVRM